MGVQDNLYQPPGVYSRGKVLGDISALDLYTWDRGSATTFDDWGEYGTDEWKWANIRAYLNKSATHHDDGNLYAPDLLRLGNHSGLLRISHADLVPELKPLRDALEKAWASMDGEVTVGVYDGTQKDLFKCVSSIYNNTRSASAEFIEGKPNVTFMPFTVSRDLEIEKYKVVGDTVVGPDECKCYCQPGCFGIPQTLHPLRYWSKGQAERQGGRVRD